MMAVSAGPISYRDFFGPSTVVNCRKSDMTQNVKCCPDQWSVNVRCYFRTNDDCVLQSVAF